ncbi:MAG: hypothetical protein JWO40_582 [Candidatus Doudnabacteria bacterium]|nr:hypothetical protein [Candidatus Doudnabacteria bacterium]
MKYLHINNGKAYYKTGENYVEIDRITREDLSSLLNLASNEDFEMDPYDERSLSNKAHQIIYLNLYNKLNNFISDKEQFKKQAESLYQAAISKYSVKVPEADLVEDEIRIEDIPF